MRKLGLLGLAAAVLSLVLAGCHMGEISYSQQQQKADALKKIAQTSKVAHNRPQ